jgi:hypothetical protein
MFRIVCSDLADPRDFLDERADLWPLVIHVLEAFAWIENGNHIALSLF